MFYFSEKCPRFVRMFQGFFCWFAFTFSRHVRHATLANAARILGPDSTPGERKRLAKAVIRNFYLFALDVGRSTHMTPEQLLAEIGTVHGYQTYTNAADEGRGLIVVTAHMGSFEVGLAGLAAQGKKLNVIFRRDNQGAFERQRCGLRERLGVVEHPVDDGLPMWIRLRDALKAGEIVIFQGDRVMPGQRGRTVPFLHGHLELPPGPVKLSRLTGAPILPIISTRTTDGKVDLHVEPPISPAMTEGGDDASTGNGSGADVDPMLTRLAAVLEKYVRTYPEQWLMFHPAFSEDRESSNPKSQT
jgi:KDO2-lipid IV(A) lauroyltransferase